jgi:hypothetical protein
VSRPSRKWVHLTGRRICSAVLCLAPGEGSSSKVYLEQRRSCLVRMLVADIETLGARRLMVCHYN